MPRRFRRRLRGPCPARQPKQKGGMRSSLISGGKKAMETNGRPRCSATVPPMSASSISMASRFALRDGFGSVAEDHARGVFDALYGEAEGGEAVEFAEALVELLKRAEGVVAGADELKVDAG